ncbi:hypothetical protein Cadr_000019293 [Camelus dromedarius]|uniref:Uncharacterized protein n=1 Tax=Camelus dromedarius TaxID=9838 RepID=A0A5N4D209_CAMDR|nr:hypothetical protein Cadr_000019293 [Camelus dromedarius]
MQRGERGGGQEPPPSHPHPHLGMLLRHVLLGELGELHQLRDDLLDIVAVGAVHQGGGHRVQDGLIRGLEAGGRRNLRTNRCFQEASSLGSCLCSHKTPSAGNSLPYFRPLVMKKSQRVGPAEEERRGAGPEDARYHLSVLQDLSPRIQIQPTLRPEVRATLALASSNMACRAGMPGPPLPIAGSGCLWTRCTATWGRGDTGEGCQGQEGDGGPGEIRPPYLRHCLASFSVDPSANCRRPTKFTESLRRRGDMEDQRHQGLGTKPGLNRSLGLESFAPFLCLDKLQRVLQNSAQVSPPPRCLP